MVNKPGLAGSFCFTCEAAGERGAGEDANPSSRECRCRSVRGSHSERHSKQGSQVPGAVEGHPLGCGTCPEDSSQQLRATRREKECASGDRGGPRTEIGM